MSRKTKYYVVWHGVQPGVYSSWDACLQQIKNFKGAIYKAFNSEQEAHEAYHSSPSLYIQHNAASATPVGSPSQSAVAPSPPTYRTDTVLPLPPQVKADALAVDAACSGNPGAMEYRGVYLRTGQEVFHFGPVYGTNNIGEFLAIVHAMALLKQKKVVLTIYSDSRNAMLWVKQRKCKTTLARNPRTEQLFQIIGRAEEWLRNNTSPCPLVKWETAEWGEVPADFGRK